MGPFRLTRAVAGRDGRCAAAGLVLQRDVRRVRERRTRGWGAYGVSKAALDHLGAHLGRGARGHGRARADRRSRRDGHGHARGGDARGRPAPRWPIRPTSRSASSRSSGRRRRSRAATRVEAAALAAAAPAAARREGRGLAARRAATRSACSLVDPRTRAALARPRASRDLPALLRPGDLLVVNDAATLPASLRGARPRRRAGRGAARWAAHEDGTWTAVALRRRRLAAAHGGPARRRRGCRRARCSTFGRRRRRAAARDRASASSPSRRGWCASRFDRERRRAVVRALPRGPARPVLVPAGAARAVARADAPTPSRPWAVELPSAGGR